MSGPSKRSNDRARGAEPRWLDADDGERREPLTRRRIVDAALRIVDEQGLAALTVRRLAAGLDVSPMAIYSHVHDKAEVIDLLVDRVVGDSLGEVDPDLDWIGQLRAICLRIRDAWSAHPGALEAYTVATANPRPMSTGPNALAMAEQVAAILARAGFPAPERAQVFMAFHSFLRGALISQPNRMHVLQEPDPEDAAAAFERFLGGVEPAAVANFLEIAPLLAPEGNFEPALDLFLAGLATAPGRQP